MKKNNILSDVEDSAEVTVRAVGAKKQERSMSNLKRSLNLTDIKL